MQDEEKEQYQDIAEPSKLRAALKLACIASFVRDRVMTVGLVMTVGYYRLPK